MEQTQEVKPYKRKVLATFHRPIAIMIGSEAVFVEAAVCEVESGAGRYADSYLIVELANGRKLDRAQTLHLPGMGAAAVVDINEALAG